jgi:hypothetical protein
VFEIVCTSSSLSGIEAALRAHFGITVPARRLLPAGLGRASRRWAARRGCRISAAW